MTEITFFYLIIFIFGMIVGSFLNVVVLRYNTGETFLKGKSKCLNCSKKLEWYELIPVASFIIQKGKCKECKSKISWQYPLVEILTGVVFLLIFNFQFSIFNEFSLYFLFSTFYFLVVFSLLIAISIYDFRHQIIPNGLVYSFIFLSFFSLFKNWKLEIGNLEILQNLLVGLALFAFFGLLWLVSRGKWMGLGDAKLALGIGWFLGLDKGIWAFLLSFWIGGAVGILLVLLRKKKYNLKSGIPFGPFLAIASLIAFLI